MPCVGLFGISLTDFFKHHKDRSVLPDTCPYSIQLSQIYWVAPGRVVLESLHLLTRLAVVVHGTLVAVVPPLVEALAAVEAKVTVVW